LREETYLSLPAQPDPSRAWRLPAAARRNLARATLPVEPHIPARCSAFLPAAHLHSIEAERALPLLQPATRRLACLCSGSLLHLAYLELSNLLACGSDLPSAGLWQGCGGLDVNMGQRAGQLIASSVSSIHFSFPLFVYLHIYLVKEVIKASPCLAP